MRYLLIGMLKGCASLNGQLRLLDDFRKLRRLFRDLSGHEHKFRESR